MPILRGIRDNLGRAILLTTTAIVTPPVGSDDTGFIMGVLGMTTLSGSTGGGTGGGSPGSWDALTPYSQVALGWKNASATPLPSPFVTTNHRMQRGDVPSGYRLGLFKADGTMISTQQDNEAPTWADGSMSSATIAAVLPDTLAAVGGGGDTASYFVKPVAGAPNRTPKFSLAAWAAVNDLRIRICTNLSNLADATAQYEFRANDAVSAGLFEGSSSGSDYPLTSIHVDRSGPVCMGWKFKGFARRVSDGAWHHTLTGELYVTAISTSDMLIDGMLKQPMGTVVGGNAAQTVGPTSGADLAPIVGVVQLWNGSTLLRTWGGPGDYRANPSITFDVTNNRLVFPASGQNRRREGLGVVFTSSGSLPGGIQPNKPYWVRSQDYNATNATLWTRRGFLSTIYGASQYQANTAYRFWDPNDGGAQQVTVSGADYSKTQVYVPVQAGTTGANSAPSGAAENQVDGTCKWLPANVVLTSAGSGTITAYPIVGIYPAAGAAFVDEQTTDPIWTGSGPAPRVEAIKDLTYLCRYARALPPYDLTLTPLYETGLPFDGFSASEPYVQSTIDYYGDDPGTNLIGYLNVSASNALLNQTSVQVQRHQRAEALGWSDYMSYLEDARSLQPIVGTAGPGNAAGRYAGMGPSIPGFWFDARGGTVSPAAFLGLGNSVNGNYYTPRYGTYLDGSHLPAYWILPWEKTARTIFLDQGIALGNGVFLSCYKGGNTTTASSRQYNNTSLINQQVRGSGWATRALDTLDDVLPAAHPVRTYVSDIIQDGLDFALAVIEENRISHSIAYAMGTLRITSTNPSLQMWMMAFYLTATSQAAKKGRRPEWRTLTEHLAGRIYLPFYDSDAGGNAGLIDWNWFGGCRVYRVGSGIVAGDTFTSSYQDNLVNGGYTMPPAVTYTVQAGQTPAQVAAGIVALVNGTAALTSFGYVATDEGSGLFRINAPGGLFNDSNNHAQVEISWSGKIQKSGNQVALLGRIDENLNLLSQFTSMTDLLAYNLGPGWAQSASTKISFAASNLALKGADGFVPWDTTDYPNIHWACMATMTEAGITKARTIYDRVTARIQQTGGGPRFSMIPYARFSPDGTGRTYNNFNLVAYHLQATRIGR